MTINRQQIRQAMLDEDFLGGHYGTATSGTIRTLTDSTLLAVGGSSAATYGNFHLYRPNADNAGDNVRLVTPLGYTAETGILQTAGPDYTEGPTLTTAGDADDGYYELWPYDPLIVNRAINRALTLQCFSVQVDDFTTNGQTRYDPTAAPISLTTLTESNQILNIHHVHGTDPNAYSEQWRKAGRTWLIEMDNDTMYIRFDPAPTGTLRLFWKKPYTALNDETTTSAVNSEYVKWASFYELYNALEIAAKRRDEDASEYTRLKSYSHQRFWVHRRQEMEQYGADLYVTRPRWASSVASPRMGRIGGRLGGYGAR